MMDDLGAALEALGFVPVNLGIRGRRGYRHPSLRGRGAVYVGDDRMSASGAYIRLFEGVVVRSASDLGYPVWHGPELETLLDWLRANFAPLAEDESPVT